MQPFKTERILRVLIGILLGTFVYVIFDAVHERIIGVGDSAPGFSIRTDNGRTITARDFGGKLLVLNFWATWCPPCISELPSLDRFSEEFSDSGVVVLAISVDKDEKIYRRFLERAQPGFLTARDPEAKISGDYGTFKYPETYIIDTNGKVVRKLIADQDWTDERIVTDVKSLLRSSPT
ncbi:MAG: TlpA disulfide reductase family protein [Bryobacteraceae bacterium]